MKKLIIIAATIALLSACAGEKSGVAPSYSVGADGSESTVTTVTQPAVTYIDPVPADFTPSLKIKDKQCFGSAGCNVTVGIRLTWPKSFDPDKTYEVSYQVNGGEDGPILGTVEVNGEDYSGILEQFLSTSSSSKKLGIKITSIEEV